MIDGVQSRVIVCRGALATEQRLLAEIARVAPTRVDELDPPVRVIVPSRSLRLHLLRRLVEEHGSVAGVVVQTLGGAAREIMERTGDERQPRQAGCELVVRRLARGEPALESELDDLDDGYGAVLGAVRDLADAGFGPELEDGVLEQVEELGSAVPRADRKRAAALIRVAARSLEAAELNGAHPRAASYRLAAEALADDSGALPARAVLVHGFADMTGVAADLLTVLLRTCDAHVLLDRTPDPVSPGDDDAGNAFLDRLELRLGGLARELDTAEPATPSVRLAETSDIEAEARLVAEAARAEIAAGVAPEAVGIVTRRPGILALPLRRQLRRLGVPVSGIEIRVPGGRVRRKARRLGDLLRRGGDAELELWVEVADGLADEVALLLGLRVLSMTRLRDLAELSPDDRRLARGVPLPLDPGVLDGSGVESDEGRRPRLDSARVAPAIERARTLLAVIDGWPARASGRSHAAQTERLLDSLGWSSESVHGEAVRGAAAGLSGELPESLEIESGEWTAELIRRLDGLGEVSVGGRGGGVQLLSVTEARGRTFDRLFVCGLDRGVFPRQVVDDAMLPDAVRARLAASVLPEMPVQARSADEERYLFAQLMSAAPVTVLSWHLSSKGKRAAPSPFIDRLRGAGLGAPMLEVGGPRPAYEHAVVDSAAAENLDVRILSLALAEGRDAVESMASTVPANRLAASRADVVRAVEAGDGPPVGPWFGFVGGATTPGEKLWVTHLEAVATCPWRAFVERRLGVRPLPDPHLGLPDPDHRLVGNVVHEVLERIVSPPGTRRLTLEEALSGAPADIAWPSDRDLEALVMDAAEKVVYSEGLGGFGLVHLLAARARPILAVAREVEWDGGCAASGVLAAEIEGELVVESTGRKIGFRADRLDTGPRATDYKTGRPLSSGKRAATRGKHLVAKVWAGRVLQAVAYALAAPGGVGRYVYLKPDIKEAPEEARVLEVSGDDPELAAAFDVAVGVIDAALVAGAGFPRVAEPGGRPEEHCRYCEVAEACRRDDSQFVMGLTRLMEEQEEGESAAATARDLWWLGVEREEAP